jgi:CubicO group peptidase (beta-lactamase class C family)
MRRILTERRTACGTPAIVREMTRTIAALACLLVSACATAAPGSRDGEGFRPVTAFESLGLAIDSLAEAMLRRGEVVGLSVAVLHRGEPVRVRGYGIADLEHRAPATDSTRYYLGSITKPITAGAVMGLAERGRLSLDDEVTRHVPELDTPGPSITLRHLLAHTSGLAGPQQVSVSFLDRRHLTNTRGPAARRLAEEIARRVLGLPPLPRGSALTHYPEHDRTNALLANGPLPAIPLQADRTSSAGARAAPYVRNIGVF